MRTKLGLQQLQQRDTTIIALADTSMYNPDLPVENAYLEVIPPEYTIALQVIYIPGNITLLTTVNLGLTTTPEEMDSGLYCVTQTIKPNDQLRETFYFFNTGPERKELACKVCEAIDNEEDLSPYYDINAELDLVELLAVEGECEKAKKLFNLTCNKLRSLCVGCVQK